MTIQPNVYVDGKWLVVPIAGAVFPKRCVKTNEPVNASDYTFEADLLWQQVQVPESGGQQAANAIAKTVFGGAGGAVLDLARKRRLKFSIGLSEKHQALAKKRMLFAILLLVAGPVLGAVFGGGSAVLTEKMYGRPHVPTVVVGAAIGVITMIAGIIFFAVSTSTLRVMRSDGEYVWLEGANPEFLATLPQSPAKWKPLKLF